MFEFVRRLLSSDGFMPHGHCYLWNPRLIALHTISDGLTALAYISIPFTLVYLIRKRRDIPFNWMFMCFGTFIVACGATHVMEIWTLWTPMYWLSGAIKAVTATASVATSVLLVALVPKALAIPTAAALAQAHDDLRKANDQLEAKVEERTLQLVTANDGLLRAEVALRALNEGLERRVKERTAEVENANRELETFSYAVAHDLRAPLRGVSGFAEVLLAEHEEKLDADGKDCLHEIRSNAQRMGELIDGLLSLARVTRTELATKKVDLTALARKVVEEISAGAPRVQGEVVVAERVEADMDPRLARALLENLLGNAWKFTGKLSVSRIEFGVAEANGERSFFVRDNGAGFDPAYASKLFTPFQRLHKSSEFPGTGIGLATVHRIVARHGGRIWADGRVGGGATFHFTIPTRLKEATP